MAATMVVQSHDVMAHLQAEHQKANRTFNKTASYKGKPEAKKEADRLKHIFTHSPDTKDPSILQVPFKRCLPYFKIQSKKQYYYICRR